MTVLEIEGRKVEVDDGFMGLSAQAQQDAVTEIAASFVDDSQNGFMGQVNQGIANTVGGLADFINPFDNDAWKDVAGGRLHVGSAVEGLKSGMNAVGADVATREPNGIVEGLGRGVGNAAGAIIPVAKGLQALRGVGGSIGAFADEAYQVLASMPGLGAELAAGGVSGGSREVAEAAGAPEWVQDSVEVVSPLAVPALASAFKGTAKVAGKMPLMGAGRRVASDVKRSLFPMTDSGAHEVAATRVRDLVGGEARATELANGIDLNSELNLTPAQQTGDPRLLGLERQARVEDPLLDMRLDDRLASSKQSAEEGINSMSGQVGDARDFFARTLRSFKASMTDSVDEAIRSGDKSISGTGPKRTEAANSTQLVQSVKRELSTQLEQERQLWAAVPKDAVVTTSQTKTIVEEQISGIPWAQRRDIPEDLRAAFADGGSFGEETSVSELYGLYSEMRRVARSAMAGNDQNKNRARIANEVAEAILKDLGAKGADTTTGQAINQARAYSRALHETFDQGAVGRILKRTIDGDGSIPSEAALKRTVGRGGPDGQVDAQNIRKSSPAANEEIQDYLRGRFSSAVVNASGEFTPKAARNWLRSNREVLTQYPTLKGEFTRAISNRMSADSFAVRSLSRSKLIEAQSSPVRFNLGQNEKAVHSILGSSNPVRTARSLAATAKKDKTGKALGGVKAAFTDYLIGGASGADALSGTQLKSLLTDRKTQATMRQVFSQSEMSRMKRIASELAKANPKKSIDVGSVMDSPANKLVEMVVRIAAARHGGSMGGGSMGGSMQTANIVVERSKQMLRNLTNDKARQLLMDAVEDPALFRALLITPKGVELPTTVRSRLAPYLTGAVANHAQSENQHGRP